MEICSWLKFHVGTPWHYLDMAVWSWYIFYVKICDKKMDFDNILKPRFLACIFVYAHPKKKPFLKYGC